MCYLKTNSFSGDFVLFKSKHTYCNCQYHMGLKSSLQIDIESVLYTVRLKDYYKSQYNSLFNNLTLLNFFLVNLIPSNSTISLKCICFYHVVPTQLLSWEYLHEYSRVTVELLQRSNNITSVKHQCSN